MRKVITFGGAGAAVAAVVAAALAAIGGTAHPVSSTSAPAVPAAGLVAHTRANLPGHLSSIGAATTATEPAGTRPAAGTMSLLVRFATGSSDTQQTAAVAAHGGTQRAAIPALHLRVVDVPTAHADSVAAAYRADHSVRSVEVDRTRQARATPSDPSYASQWALPQIGWDQLYGAVSPAGTATIAVLDTGVDGTHPDLAGRLVPGYSAFAGSDPASDPNGHGTWMAGIAAATTNNAAGIAGVAYSGVSIMPVQVLDASGTGQDSDIVNGVIWAADHGADVIVMSFSNTGYSQALQDAVSYAWSKGAVLVAATGNDSSSTITYPAGDADVMGVSGTDQSDALAAESNYGVDTFVAAPSEDVLTTDTGGGYRSISGTSASAAIVAGVAAFERALDGTLSNGAIDGRIARNAAPAGTAEQTGNGRVDMLRTVSDTSTDAVIPAGAGAGGGTFVGPYSDAAAATDGSGTMTVVPTSALAGSTGDSFTFTFRIPNKTGNFAGQSRIFFPVGWTQPQTSSASGAGFVSIVSPSNCATKSINSISGSATTGYTVVVDTSCNSRKKYTLSYTNVTAPAAGTYTFTTATKLTSGTFTNIAASPVVTVNPAGATPTTTTVARTAGTNPDLYGQSLTFTATVTASSGPNPSTGQGTVDFVDTTSAATICSAVALSGNTATCTVNNLDAGAYTIQASYSGTTGSPAFAGSSSGTVNQTVNAAGTSTALVSNNNPSTVGGSVTFTATVTTTASGGTNPNGDGTVTFNDGTTTVCAAVVLIGNVATCTTSSLTVGTHSMTAVYTPDSTLGDFTTSTSSPLSQVVNAGALDHFLVSGFANPTTAGVAHTFTVAAKDAGNNTIAGYTGTVTFTSSDGHAVLPGNYTFTGSGSGKDNGVHTFSATLETVGTRSITAADTVSSTITGAQTGIVVNPAGAATLVVSGYPSPSAEGSGGSVTVTAKDAYGNVATGYTGTVHLTSSDALATLPANHTFTGGDAGVYTFSGAVLKTEGAQSITATDTATSSITGSQPVQVIDAALHATAGSPIHAVEGASVSATVATFTDDNPYATTADYTASITWGDGSSSSGVVAASGGGFTVSGSHTYAEEGSDTVQVTVTDAGGSTAATSLSATVADAALHIVPPSSVNFIEGAASGAVKLGSLSDDDPGGVATDYRATVDWGDGSPTESASVGAPVSGSFPITGAGHTYAEEGTHTITVSVTDAGGSTSTATITAQIADAALHAVAQSFNPIEGAAFNGTVASFSDDDPNGTGSDYTATIDWGDGTSTSSGTVQAPSSGSFPVSGAHTYAEEGTHTVLITVSDAGGSTSTTSEQITVADAALHAAAAADPTPVEGAAFTAPLATFTDDDPGGALSDYTATVTWGDGSTSSGAISTTAGGFAVSGTHTYAEEGSFVIAVTVTDTGGSTASTSLAAVVADAALHSAAPPSINTVEGASSGVLSVASFTDDDPGGALGDYTASIDWGDGTAAATGTVGSPTSGTFPVTGSHTYAEEGVYTATITVVDAGGSTAATTTTVHVADAALHLVAAPSVNPVEGATTGAVSLAGLTDDDPGGTTSDYTAKVDWGDGTVEAASVGAPSGGSFPVSSAGHTYVEEGTYTVTVTVTDAGGSTATTTLSARVADAALHAVAQSFLPVEGAAFTGTVGSFTDDDPGGVLTDYTASISWGDGTTASAGTVHAPSGSSFPVSGTHTYAEEGTYTVLITVSDAGGSTSTTSEQITVADAALHATAAPTINAVEGAATGSVPLASLTDDDPGGTTSDYTAKVNWGDGTATQAAIVGSPSSGSFPVSSAGHVFAEEGTYTVLVSVTDAGGSTTTTAFTASVADAALHSTAAPNLHPVEGAATGSVPLASLVDDDPGGTVGDYTATVDWGDSTPTQTATVGSPSGGSFPVTSTGHVYAEEGTYTVTVTVTDAGGSATATSLSATVADAALHAAAQAIAPVEGAAFSGTVATFTDDDPGGALSDYTARISWGDGNTDTGTVGTGSGGFSVAGGHTYAEEGVFTVTTTVTDAGGSTSTTSRQVTVADAALNATAAGPIATYIDTPTGTVNVATFSDADPAGTLSDYTATVNWGDGSPVTAGGISTTSGGFVVSGSHTYTTYPSGSSFPVTVTITDSGGSVATVVGSATVSAIPVTVGTPTASPASVWFADSTTLSATISSLNGNGGPLQGTATFRVNGNPVAGIPVSVNTSTTSQTVSASIRLDQTVVPLGAGSYTISVTFTGSNANYQYYNTTSPASTGSVTVTQKPVTLSYAGDWFVQDTATPSLSVVVDQTDGGDPSFVDYSKVHVTAQFSIYNGTGGLLGSVTAPVSDASNWSTTGLGSAKTSWTGPLNDGSYQVVVTILSNGYVSGPDVPATLTSSPVTGSFVTGGGFINPDSTSNTPDTNHKGNFGITVKFNKSGSSLQGNAIYVYRLYMDVTTGSPCGSSGGPNCRDVDVVVKSNSLSSLTVSPTSSTTANAVITGKFSVQYNDALNGTQYTQFGFGNGTFQINVTDGGTGGSNDTFGEVMRRPDGTVFHLGSYPGTTVSSSTGSAQQEPLGGGNITVHQS